MATEDRKTDPQPLPAAEAAATSQTQEAVAVSAVIAEGVKRDPADAGGETPAPSTDLEKLINAVLDSAGVANRSADVAAGSTEQMLNSISLLDTATRLMRRHAYVILGATLVVQLFFAGIFLWGTSQLTSRLAQVERTMAVLGKRSVELNSALAGLKRVETALEELKRDAAVESIARLDQKFDAGLAELRAQTAAPRDDKAAREDAARRQREDLAQRALLTSQIKALDAQTVAQSRAMAKLAAEVAASRADLQKAVEASRGVEALLGALRQRAAQTQAAAAAPAPAVREREKPVETRAGEFIQFPDPQAGRNDKSRPAAEAGRQPAAPR